MTRKDAFKVGFMLKFAEMGYAPDEVYDLLEGHTKTALMGEVFTGISDVLKGVGSVGVAAAKTVGGTLIPAAVVGVPLVVGATAGAIASKLTSPDQGDVDVFMHKLQLLRYKKALDDVNRRRIVNAKLKEKGVL